MVALHCLVCSCWLLLRYNIDQNATRTLGGGKLESKSYMHENRVLPDFNWDVWPCWSQVGHISISRAFILHLLSCKCLRSAEVESIGHNMLGYLQSNPHMMIKDDEWVQPRLHQLHFDRSVLAVCLLATTGSMRADTSDIWTFLFNDFVCNK